MSSLVFFARGVIARLALWPALRIAVDESWGGPESSAKRTWIASVIVDAFQAGSPKPDAVYVEETLLQVMEDEFDAVIDDDSSENVAKDIVRLWSEVHEGEISGVLELEAQVENLRRHKIVAHVVEGVVETHSGDDDGNEDEDEEAPELLMGPESQPREEPEIDEDGFTKITSKRTHG